jgi:hypothetical protein
VVSADSRREIFINIETGSGIQSRGLRIEEGPRRKRGPGIGGIRWGNLEREKWGEEEGDGEKEGEGEGEGEGE